MKTKVKNDQHVLKQPAIDHQEAASQNDDNNNDDEENNKKKESELQSLLNELFSQTDLLERLLDPEKHREEPSTSLTACHLCGSITHDKDNISSENKNGVSKPTLSPPMVNYIISLILLPISAWIVLCWLTH